MQALIIALLLAGCTQLVEVAVEPEDVSEIAEAYCKANPTLPCGKVYQCEQAWDNPIGHVEICIPQFIDPAAATSYVGACELSTDPRFDDANLCWWCCGPGCTAGCNAYNGCFCVN